MARKAIHAAGGIVVRGGGARPRIAIVRRSKDDRWVLPRGKLKRDESPLAGARREAVEETGHRVHVHEFLGAITYTVRGQPKVVQFWRMRAAAQPSHDLTKDIAAVKWLPLAKAVRRLSFSLERLFLLSVAPHALKPGRRGARRKPAGVKVKSRRRVAAKGSRKTSAKAAAKHAAKNSNKLRSSKTRLSKGRTRKRRTRPRKARRAASRHIGRATAAHGPVVRAERRGILQRVLGRLGR